MLGTETWVTRPKNQWFERKSFRIKPKDLAKAFVGFANSEGGTVAVGIRDRQFEGHPTAKQDNDLRQASFDFTDPTVKVNLEVVSENGVDLYLFKILPSDRVHFLVSGECFIRIGDETRQLSADEILELRYAKGEQQFDAAPHSSASIDDIDMAAVQTYAEAIGSASAHDALRARNLITRDHLPRTATLLLFGRSPQEFFPNAYIRVLVWNEPERLPGSQQQLIHDKRFEGTIPEQISAARTFIAQTLPQVRRLGEHRIFETDRLIPDDIWLEGLVNAVIHRSYSLIGDHIRFEIFPDKITISSPGRFPGLADPRQPEMISRYARNPLIARVTSELHFGQELGEGIRRMFAGMRRIGFLDPIYQQTAGSVILTLRAVQRLDPSMVARLPKHSSHVLELLQRENRPLSTGAIAELLGVSTPPVRKALQALRDERLVEWNGTGPRDPRATWSLKGPLR